MNLKGMLSPRDCLLGICFPINRHEYQSQVSDTEAYEFARRVSPRFRDYHHAVIKPTLRLVRVARQLGADVRMNFALGDLDTSLREGHGLCLILFAHWREDGVEFADGYATSDTIINHIPTSFSGILDLCVCHPGKLVGKIRNSRPDIGAISWTTASRTLGLWVGFYQALLFLLARGDLTYTSALNIVLEGFYERSTHGILLDGMDER